MKKINSALISVFDKNGLPDIVNKLTDLGVKIYSTGGTQKFIESLGAKVVPVEELTAYPSILGGRVKTLHPKIFGGILGRREEAGDLAQLAEFEIPEIDLVVVDLYPFEETVIAGGTEQEIIEKIDIGGISLIRAAAKNFNDVVIISHKQQYAELIEILDQKQGFTNQADRKNLAAKAFAVSSNYDTAIFNYFNNEANIPELRLSERSGKVLRYGENPHQKGTFFGDMAAIFDQLHGKELSYNNLLDLDSGLKLLNEFDPSEITFIILKHNNACGLAIRENLKRAYLDALTSDPVSAFGGVLLTNQKVDLATAEEINKLFCEIIIAPDFVADALELLKSKKNRMILKMKELSFPNKSYRSALNGILVQDSDNVMTPIVEFQQVTKKAGSKNELNDLLFANKIVKHTKSNTIVLAKNQQLLASGTGQTSRVDALNQAIGKAKTFGFDLQNSVMASDAFFPFPDCVEIAHNEGITSIIQPGGSIKDDLSIQYCDENDMYMVFTSKRHFKH